MATRTILPDIYALGRETLPVLLGGETLGVQFLRTNLLVDWTSGPWSPAYAAPTFFFSFFFFVLRVTQRTSGTGLGINDTKVSVPLRASTAQPECRLAL